MSDTSIYAPLGASNHSGRERIPCAQGGDFSAIKSSAVSYAWFLWVKGYRGPTMVQWI